MYNRYSRSRSRSRYGRSTRYGRSPYRSRFGRTSRYGRSRYRPMPRFGRRY